MEEEERAGGEETKSFLAITLPKMILFQALFSKKFLQQFFLSERGRGTRIPASKIIYNQYIPIIHQGFSDSLSYSFAVSCEGSGSLC